MKLYEIIDRVNAEQGTDLAKEALEPLYRREVARLFDSELQQIPGASELLAQVTVPVCTVSNGPVSKMQHSLGLTGMLILMTGCSAAMTFSAGSRIRRSCITPPNRCRCR